MRRIMLLVTLLFGLAVFSAGCESNSVEVKEKRTETKHRSNGTTVEKKETKKETKVNGTKETTTETETKTKVK